MAIMKLKMNFIFKIRIYSLKGRVATRQGIHSSRRSSGSPRFCIAQPHVRILFFIEK
jgi:hypothetical protein